MKTHLTSVAQAGSLPYRGLPIREPRENSASPGQTDAPPTASRRHSRLTICATNGTRRLAPPMSAASARVVAQAGSLPSRGLAIRETLDFLDAPPTASRRHSRLTLCATPQSPGNPLEINRP
jgi:hypothetical protein